MSVGLKHSHYWENQQLGGDPGDYQGLQVFWFQNFPRGPAINPMVIALMLHRRRIEEDEEEMIAALF